MTFDTISLNSKSKESEVRRNCMYKQYINGKTVDGLGKKLDVYNPATDEIVGTVGCATAEQTKVAD